MRRRSAPRIVCKAAPAQCIELQIDFEPRHALRQSRGEIGLGGNPDAVGVEHDMADIAALGGGDDRKRSGVQGRLAAADLQQVGLAFARGQGVEHALRWSARGSWPESCGEDPAKQVGQVRLQVSLISISARQLCCSWSGQSPQS